MLKGSNNEWQNWVREGVFPVSATSWALVTRQVLRLCNVGISQAWYSLTLLSHNWGVQKRGSYLKDEMHKLFETQSFCWCICPLCQPLLWNILFKFINTIDVSGKNVNSYPISFVYRFIIYWQMVWSNKIFFLLLRDILKIILTYSEVVCIDIQWTCTLVYSYMANLNMWLISICQHYYLGDSNFWYIP